MHAHVDICTFLRLDHAGHVAHNAAACPELLPWLAALYMTRAASFPTTVPHTPAPCLMLQLGGVAGVHGHSSAVHVQLPHDGGPALQAGLPGLGAARTPPQAQQAHLSASQLSTPFMRTRRAGTSWPGCMSVADGGSPVSWPAVNTFHEDRMRWHQLAWLHVDCRWGKTCWLASCQHLSRGLDAPAPADLAARQARAAPQSTGGVSDQWKSQKGQGHGMRATWGCPGRLAGKADVSQSHVPMSCYHCICSFNSSWHERHHAGRQVGPTLRQTARLACGPWLQCWRGQSNTEDSHLG